jgi:serine phosphatase RsbU (regulator of sigma subunit)
VTLQLEVIDGRGRRPVTVDGLPYTIGRSSENRLQIADGQVSRKHAQIVHADEGWRIQDCGSRLGTFVNDVKISDSLLKPGDLVRIGLTEIRIADHRTSSTLGGGPSDFRQMNALLAGLRALGSSSVLDEVLAVVLDSALDLTGAERGIIFLANAAGGLEPGLARARGGVTLKSDQTSRRIPEQVFATGEDRIVWDLLDDAHALVHMGTIQLGIRHVLCTPLRVMPFGSEGIERRLGVLYLDSRERGHLQHAEALHALAGEAAVVIENARLYREALERERAAEELRVAARIQQALLPGPRFSCAFAELAAHTTPCLDVGGDFFDYTQRANGDITFMVADVAGKGTSAALLTAVCQGLLDADTEAEDDPAQVLQRVNRGLCRRGIASRFVTAFFGQLSPSGALLYCNAGHNPPLLLSAGGLQHLNVGGPVLGVFDAFQFKVGCAQLDPGDTLVMFSDGVTEAENADGDEFGDSRLEACLIAMAATPAPELLAAIDNEVRTFCGAAAPRDDLTIMVVKRV